MRKTLLYLMLLFLLSTLASGCGDKPNALTSLDPRTKVVREGHLINYKNVSIGDAYNAFFSDPQWRYFETSNKERIVEFSGGCTYMDTPVKVTQQFKVHADNSFAAGYLAFNDVPQVQLISAAMIATVFESYGTKQSKAAEAFGSQQTEYPGYRNGSEKDAQELLYGRWEETGNSIRDLGLPKNLTLNSRNAKIIIMNNISKFPGFPNGYEPAVYIGNDDSVFWAQINGSIYRIHIEYGKRSTMNISWQRSNGNSGGEQSYIRQR